jgi:hypothetical protein
VKTLFLAPVVSNDKACTLGDAVAALRENKSDANVYTVEPVSLRQVPGSPLLTG